jgi:toxin YoeB
MIKSWSDAAWEDFEYWTKQDKKTLYPSAIEGY